MKKSKLQPLLRTTLLLFALLPSTSFTKAKSFYSDGIYYYVDSEENKFVSVYGGGWDNHIYSGSIIIPSNVTFEGITYKVVRIQETAFYRCSELTAISIPNTITTIDQYAFYCCSGLTSITIPKSLTSMGHRAFEGCIPNKLTWNAKNCTYNGNMTTSKITEVTIGNIVEVLPGNFASGSKITEVTIPNSVTTIGYNAFSGCSGLTGVTIPESVSSIGGAAFSGCSALTTLNYNAASCADFGYGNDHPFYNSNITTIKIGNSVKKIAANFANSMTRLTSVTIPNSVTTIGYNAFSGCSGLTSVTIPNSVTTIGYNAFSGCSGLTSVTIPNSVAEIGGGAFQGCEGLTQLVWNAKNCSSNGNMPSSNITQVKIGSMVEVLPDYFVQGSKITSVILPSSLTTINSCAFFDCDNLSNVTIPNSVTTINTDAFYGCDNLTDVTIGNSVHTISSSAFANCKKLMYVSCNAIMPPKYIPYNSYDVLFDDITYQNAILYVPDLTYNYYKQSEPWNKFMEIKAEPYCDSGVGFDAKVYPTSVRMDAGDESEECYFTFENKQYQPLLVTGLEPNNIYSTTYTRDWGEDVPLKFFTAELRMVPEGGKMLTATAAQLMAETNMADEETMCGFDWRRLEGPDDYLGTRAYCPVYDGKMAGTLKKLSKDTWYKFRPFYKSNAGNVYYGDWVTFYSGDWGVEFDPVVYTYNSPAVSQTDATLQGVALRGSSEISEQGFEYWKSGTSNVKKVTASGERMSATVNGLDPETSYKFRAFVTADGKTVRGADVEFATRMGEHHVDNSLDVNADGVVNIADMNVVINVILKGSNDNKCDVNGDGTVNISDINAIIAAILGN